MCVNKLKSIAGKTAKFLVNKTSIDYEIASKFVRCGLQLFDGFSHQEMINFINLLHNINSRCVMKLHEYEEEAIRKGGSINDGEKEDKTR